jgi:fructose-bisphosphate aldolase class II
MRLVLTNINNLEQTLGLFKGCIESQAPFIIQLSKGSRKYADKRMLEAIIRTASQIYPEAVFGDDRRQPRLL